MDHSESVEESDSEEESDSDPVEAEDESDSDPEDSEEESELSPSSSVTSPLTPEPSSSAQPAASPARANTRANRTREIRKVDFIGGLPNIVRVPDLRECMPNPLERVLVTGAAGFLGQAVCRMLHEQGRSVIGIDRDASAPRQAGNLAELDASFELFLSDDLLDLPLESVLRSVDGVVHLAGSPGVQSSWAEGFAGHLANNVQASQRLFEAALQSPVRRIVVASSSSVYGTITEDAACESSPIHPLSPYGASKAAVEHVANAYVSRGVPIVALRYFTIYGPRQRPDMAIHQMLAALHGAKPFTLRGDGSQIRNYTYVDDAAAATVAALDSAVTPGRVFNVAGTSAHSLTDVLGEIERAAGREVPLKWVPRLAGDPDRTHADISRAQAELGWSPQVSLVEGIAAQLAWQANHQDSPLTAAGRV